MRPKLVLIRLLTMLVVVLPLLLALSFFQSKHNGGVISMEIEKRQFTLEDLEKFNREQIIYAKTIGNGARIFLTNGRWHTVKSNLKELEARIPFHLRLPRVNQSYLVNEECKCACYNIYKDYTPRRPKDYYIVWIDDLPLEVSITQIGLVKYLFTKCPYRKEYKKKENKAQ